MFLENKVALITGGASGLGLCYAIELLKNGLKVNLLFVVLIIVKFQSFFNFN